MSVEYIFTKANIYMPKLIDDINESGDVSIDVDYINHSDDPTDNLKIYMADTLTTEQETALGTVVTNHDGDPPDADNLTITKMLKYGFEVDDIIVLRKINIEFFKTNPPETAVAKVYALSKKLEAGFSHYLRILHKDEATYSALAKQYVADKYAAEELTEEEYNIIYGILNNTLPA